MATVEQLCDIMIHKLFSIPKINKVINSLLIYNKEIAHLKTSRSKNDVRTQKIFEMLYLYKLYQI